jgi:plastocyanin
VTLTRAERVVERQRAIRVLIKGFAFHPASVSAAVGTRITFVNRDSAPHSATAAWPGPDTGPLRRGQSKTIVLTTPDTFHLICEFHAFMQATIVVHRPGRAQPAVVALAG